MYANDGTLPFNPCKACNAKGKYIGFSVIENPCKSCRGLGIENGGVGTGVWLGFHARYIFAILEMAWNVRAKPRRVVRMETKVVHKDDSPAAMQFWQKPWHVCQKPGEPMLPWWYYFEVTFSNGKPVSRGGSHYKKSYTIAEREDTCSYEEQLVQMCEGSAAMRAKVTERINLVVERKLPVESLFSWDIQAENPTFSAQTRPDIFV